MVARTGEGIGLGEVVAAGVADGESRPSLLACCCCAVLAIAMQGVITRVRVPISLQT